MIIFATESKRFTIAMNRLKLFFLSLIVACGLSSTIFAQTGQFIPAERFSSGLISQLCQDRYGNVWVATDYGLNRYDGYRFSTYLHQTADPNSLCDNAVVSLLSDSDGNLWVGTSRGLDRYLPASNDFQHYPFPGNNYPRVTSLTQLPNGNLLVGTAGYGAYVLNNGKLEATQEFAIDDNDMYMSRAFRDSQGRVWKSGFDDVVLLVKGNSKQVLHSVYSSIKGFAERPSGQVVVASQRGLMTLTTDGRLVDTAIDQDLIHQHDMVISCVKTDPHGNLLIGTRGNGMLVLPSGGSHVERLVIDANGIDMVTARIRDIMFDRLGNLWLAVEHKGLLFVPARPLQFRSWSFAAQGVRLGSTISSVCEGDNGTIWCTVQGVGVYGFNENGRIVAHPSAPDAVEFIFRDRQKNYWIGTDNGLFSYDPLTGQSELRVTFDCDKFNDMTSDDRGNIYISTFSRGFCIFNPKTGSLRNHTFHDADTTRGRLCNDWIMGMMPDRAGNIWLATSDGVTCYDPINDSFQPAVSHSAATAGSMHLLVGVMCYSLCETKDGNILIGTDRGIFVYDPHHPEQGVKSFEGGEILADKVVGYVIEAIDGDIWCSTSMGIWQYDTKLRKFIGHISGNGLAVKEYISCVGHHTDTDQVYFATADGLTVFNPSQVTGTHTALPDVQLTGFYLAGKVVDSKTLSDGKPVVDVPVSEADRFRVSYIDNMVTLEFSLLDYNSPQNIIFEYRIEGGAWVQNPEGNNSIQLSHLQPGTYRIEVRAFSGGIYSNVKTITLEVTPPWYRTTLAKILYALAALLLLGILLWSYRRRANQRMNEEKMKFLINTTHDIRSPLTIILSALKKLKPETLTAQENETGAYAAERHAALETINRNSQRILNLVNQILDVRKIDKQQMHLHCQQTEMVAFVKGICKMFEFSARERGIDFQFDHGELERLNVWIDRTQFDKVVTNLLSNAFKYCAEGEEGRVAITISQTTMPRSITPAFMLQITDNGIGLDADSQKHIFDRFYQGSNSRLLHVEGTGIGLNLCKMIVDMHHGIIDAQNRTDGQQGALFTVLLPLGNSHLSSEEIEIEKQEPQAVVTTDGTQSATPKKQQGMRHRVLVVDDDTEIGNYISTELGNYYRFTLCPNGKEGLKELLMNEYDVVVSDVMMPEMDGFTMLRMIKTNANVAHVPVIMLTSKADVANRLEGLERGADAFLAKPFDMEELHMVIDNLIQSRQRLKGKYSGAQQQADKVELPEVKGNDELLMERIMKAVNKNLSDSDFNVDMLTREVGISRAQLHRKMKELTGISTSEFIRNIRLEQAARLLKEQKINVTQVAYTVGFSNLAHFSTVFRKHFGMTPTEYAERE